MIIVRTINVSGTTSQWGKDVDIELVCDEEGLRAIVDAAKFGEWQGADVVAEACGAWLRDRR